MGGKEMTDKRTMGEEKWNKRVVVTSGTMCSVVI